MAWRHAEDASTSAVGLIIAAATFGIAFTAANLMVESPGGFDRVSPQLDTRATNVLEIIVTQAGQTASGTPWLTTSAGVLPDPDLVARFGLASDPNVLDYRKIKSMRSGVTAQTSNDAPDYQDVRTGLGLSEGDFHLRTYPVIPSLDDPRWAKDPRGRLAYFAHYSGASAPGSFVAWTNVTDRILNVSVAVRNDATIPAIFVANVGLGDRLDNEVLVDEQRHTRLLAPQEVQTLWVEFPRLSSWSDDFDATRGGVRLDLTDSYGNTVVAPAWRQVAAPEGGAQTWGVTLHANQLYYQSGDTIKFTGDHFDGDGDHSNQDKLGRFVLVKPDGTEMVNTTTDVVLPKQNNQQWTYSCTTCTTVGAYTARLWARDGATLLSNASDVVHVAAGEMFDEKTTIDPLATKEIAILKGLVANFNGLRYDQDTNTAGDVFGDDQNGPNDIAALLGRYSTLVVGSEVSQTSLNSASTKHAIRDWVQAGGNLIVLGTEQQQSNWLEPIYHAAQITANGGIGTPDPTHPVLSSPNKMDYARYLDRGRAWDIESDAPFTHILTRAGGNAHSMRDTLAIAAPGAYNDGTVVLTSYMPGALTTPQDDTEAKRFLHNLLSQSYNMLFLDFGPPIPDKTPVGSAQRLVAVPHPNVPGAVVEVRIVMYAWN